MPWMNFDLQDGKPPVGFNLKPEDCDRFVKFMAECNAALQSQAREPLAWLYEDTLPPEYPYDAMHPHSRVDGVRMFPVFGPPAADKLREAAHCQRPPRGALPNSEEPDCRPVVRRVTHAVKQEPGQPIVPL